MKIEILDKSNIGWINEIHELEFGKKLSLEDLEDPYRVIGVKKLAYMIYTEVMGEADIVFIAVKEEHKRQGIASRIIKSLDADIFLEVKDTNIPAINFYKKMGFKEYARRRNYYKDADAILMKYKRGLGC